MKNLIPWKVRCRQEYLDGKRRWYQKYKAKVIAYQKDRYIKNKESLALYWAEHYRKNKDKKREYDRKYRDKTRVKQRLKSLMWARRNPQSARNWEKSNPEKYKISKKKWESKNKPLLRHHCHVRRARIAKVSFDDTAKHFIKWVKTQNEIGCAYCAKIIAGKDAHIDHVVAITKGGAHIASNLAASCQACNLSKGNKSVEEWNEFKNMKQSNPLKEAK